jgi:hypothetical protein
MPGYLVLTFRDGFGRESTRRIEMTDQVLLADYIANCNLLMNLIEPVTDLAVVKAAMRITDGLILPAGDGAGSNIDVGATFSGFLSGGDGKKGVLKMPGFPLAKVGPDGVIDVTDVDVAAYLDLFGNPPNNKFRISDGEYVTEWLRGTLDK